MLRTYYALSLKANKLSIPLLFLFITSFSFGQAARISGIITNAETGETLIGANVYIRETGQGMATDLNGYYVLDNLGLESKTLVVSFLGFEQYEKALLLEPGQSQKIDVALKTEIIEMDEIDVSAEKATRQFNIQPGRVNLSTRQIKAMPSILEPDIFRTIQALPGVLTQSEFSTGLIIRG
ncbi:MAG TPA: carboxypeptidase-like regulatory domain-containing protein, partial [Candidatus Marinimicrobia bacterium]|nr:carboxypeptidase-like regulatory domain-containing protein [Candidatus Neomarinimicrobiota bacterium]